MTLKEKNFSKYKWIKKNNQLRLIRQLSYYIWRV